MYTSNISEEWGYLYGTRASGLENRIKHTQFDDVNNADNFRGNGQLFSNYRKGW